MLPSLSAYDPIVWGEGSRDPLGLEAMADRLAEELLPSMTARMHRIRVLTVIAVGAAACEPLMREHTADQTAPAWLVYEWMYAESLAKGGREAKGLPGVDTASQVLLSGGRLASRFYLKSAVSLGLHGFYRTLAKGMSILDSEGYLDENGARLVQAWEEDQGLHGFLDGRDEGGRLRDLLRSGVEQSLEVSRSNAPITGRAMVMLRNQLTPAFNNVCRRERHLLRELVDEDERRYMTFSLLEHPDTDQHSGDGERVLAEWLLRQSRNADGQAYDQIEAWARVLLAYERLASLITEAFDLIRWRSTQHRSQLVSQAELVDGRHAEIMTELSTAVRECDAAFGEVDGDQDRDRLVDSFRDIESAGALVGSVLERHEDVQQAKGRQGKRSWFNHGDRGLAVRATYAKQQQPAPAGGFIHKVRIENVCEFLEELR